MTTTRPGRTSPPSTVSRPRGERTPPDPSWRRLYRAGAWAAAVYVVMVLTPMVLLATAPLPPSSGAAVLEYIDSHRVVYLVELVCFVGLSVPSPGRVHRLGHGAQARRQVHGAHRWAVRRRLRDHRPGGRQQPSVPQRRPGRVEYRLPVSDHAPTSAPGWPAPPMPSSRRRTRCPGPGCLTAAGILVLSLLAWRGPVPAGVAAFGIVTGAVGIVAESLRPLIDYGYLIYGLLLPTWFILTGWTLHTLARHPRIASQPSTDDPANDHARPGDTTEG